MTAYIWRLLNSAGLKPKRGLKIRLKVYTYKIVKFFLRPFPKLLERYRANKGSDDYRAASHNDGSPAHYCSAHYGAAHHRKPGGLSCLALKFIECEAGPKSDAFTGRYFYKNLLVKLPITCYNKYINWIYCCFYLKRRRAYGYERG